MSNHDRLCPCGRPSMAERDELSYCPACGRMLTSEDGVSREEARRIRQSMRLLP